MSIITITIPSSQRNPYFPKAPTKFKQFKDLNFGYMQNSYLLSLTFSLAKFFSVRSAIGVIASEHSRERQLSP